MSYSNHSTSWDYSGHYSSTNSGLRQYENYPKEDQQMSYYRDHYIHTTYDAEQHYNHAYHMYSSLPDTSMPPPPAFDPCPPPPPPDEDKSETKSQNKELSDEDEKLISDIIHQLKINGVFDKFRKIFMSDIDTYPAYNNLHSKMNNTVESFLTATQWVPSLVKNKARDKLREKITRSSYFSVGIDSLVDQIVNPKARSDLTTSVEEEVYKFMGIERPSEDQDCNQEVDMDIDQLDEDGVGAYCYDFGGSDLTAETIAGKPVWTAPTPSKVEQELEKLKDAKIMDKDEKLVKSERKRRIRVKRRKSNGEQQDGEELYDSVSTDEESPAFEKIGDISPIRKSDRSLCVDPATKETSEAETVNENASIVPEEVSEDVAFDAAVPNSSPKIDIKSDNEEKNVDFKEGTNEKQELKEVREAKTDSNVNSDSLPEIKFEQNHMDELTINESQNSTVTILKSESSFDAGNEENSRCLSNEEKANDFNHADQSKQLNNPNDCMTNTQNHGDKRAIEKSHLNNEANVNPVKRRKINDSKLDEAEPLTGKDRRKKLGYRILAGNKIRWIEESCTSTNFKMDSVIPDTVESNEETNSNEQKNSDGSSTDPGIIKAAVFVIDRLLEAISKAHRLKKASSENNGENNHPQGVEMMDFEESFNASVTHLEFFECWKEDQKLLKEIIEEYEAGRVPNET